MTIARWTLAALALALGCGSGVIQWAFGQGPSADATRPVADYRQFAMQQDGDAARGRNLFHDEQRLACSNCHSLDSKGGKAGPDLYSVGDQFSRRDLIDAVLQPSASIAVGYGTTVVETKSGEEFQGVLKQVTRGGIELMGGDGQLVRVARSDIREQHGSNVSLMPEGLHAGLSLREFTDLIEHLVTLKQTDHALANIRGMPDTIPQLTRPVALRPCFGEDFQVTAKAAAPGGNGQLGLIWFRQVPGFAQRFLVAHQAGIIWLVEKGGQKEARSVFVDFTSEVFSARGPNGLLGVAFHPRFRENRKYYLKHQVFEDGRITTLLVERQFAPDFNGDSGQPSRLLLKIPAVAEHHNGGCIAFGPDGFLYFGMGDSAPNFDPLGYGQDLNFDEIGAAHLDSIHRP